MYIIIYRHNGSKYIFSGDRLFYLGVYILPAQSVRFQLGTILQKTADLNRPHAWTFSHEDLEKTSMTSSLHLGDALQPRHVLRCTERPLRVCRDRSLPSSARRSQVASHRTRSSGQLEPPETHGFHRFMSHMDQAGRLSSS